MELLFGLVVLAALGALITGAARFAVPGPDPMPLWLMSVIGAVSAIVGGGIGFGVGGRPGAVAGSVLVATLILIGYRRVVQKRGITGPGAQRLPTRGIGIARMRRQWGVDESRERESVADQLRRLGELRAEGLISDAEFEQKRAELLQRL